MIIKQFNFLVFVLFPVLGVGQTIYFDPGVSGALIGYSQSLKNGQNKIADEQSQLQKAQTFVSTQVALVNDVQKKIYKGLSEVSTTLSNGIQVKHIYSELEQCSKYSKDIANLVKKQPQYAIFGAKATQKSYEQVLKITLEISSVLQGGEKNLMTAGDRYRLLDSIEGKIATLKIWLATIKVALEHAQMVGFWKSINPFQGYINTDRDIIQNIMDKYKHQF